MLLLSSPRRDDETQAIIKTLSSRPARAATRTNSLFLCMTIMCLDPPPSTPVRKCRCCDVVGGEHDIHKVFTRPEVYLTAAPSSPSQSTPGADVDALFFYLSIQGQVYTYLLKRSYINFVVSTDRDTTRQTNSTTVKRRPLGGDDSTTV